MSVLETCPGCGQRHLLFPIDDKRLCLACFTDHKKGRTPS